MEQALLPTLEWPALVPGPVFLAFELWGKPGHKGRHRYRKMVPKEAWIYPRDQRAPRYMTQEGVDKIFIQEYPDPATEAYEKTIREYASLLMKRRPPTERAVALLVHSFREVPKSYSKIERARCLAHNILPTPRPDWDNYGKITDALNEIVWKDDCQVCDGRVIKRYSASPALRVEIREMIEPS